jgi:hypothetical protein
MLSAGASAVCTLLPGAEPAGEPGFGASAYISCIVLLSKETGVIV